MPRAFRGSDAPEGQRYGSSSSRRVVGAAIVTTLVAVLVTALVIAILRPWRFRSARHDVYVSFQRCAVGPTGKSRRATVRVRRVGPSLPGSLVDEGDDECSSMVTLVMQRILMRRATNIGVVPEEVVLERHDGSAARILFAQRRIEERKAAGSKWLWAAELPEGTETHWSIPVRPGQSSSAPFLHIVVSLDLTTLGHASTSPLDVLISNGGRLWGSARSELRPNRHLTAMPVRTPAWTPSETPVSTRGIPPRVFQTFRRIGGRIPTRMRRVMHRWAEREPELEHYFYDDEACRDMISCHFSPRVLRAYDALVPTAYKADLWRACVLLLYGGFYFDVKISTARGIRLLREVGPDIDVLLASDQPSIKRLGRRRDGIWNAVMGFPRGHPMLRAYIDAIVSNVERRFYGETSLDITGPRLLGAIAKDWYGMGPNLDCAGPARQLRGRNGRRDTVVVWRMSTSIGNAPKVWSGGDHTRAILDGEYSGYRTDQSEFETCEHYGRMWLERRVYGESRARPEMQE